MRMNTDSRKAIFCTAMASEDATDAFEKLVKLVIKNNKEREVAFVMLDCCLQVSQAREAETRLEYFLEYSKRQLGYKAKTYKL